MLNLLICSMIPLITLLRELIISHRSDQILVITNIMNPWISVIRIMNKILTRKIIELPLLMMDSLNLISTKREIIVAMIPPNLLRMSLWIIVIVSWMKLINIQLSKNWVPWIRISRDRCQIQAINLKHHSPRERKTLMIMILDLKVNHLKRPVMKSLLLELKIIITIRKTSNTVVHLI